MLIDTSVKTQLNEERMVKERIRALAADHFRFIDVFDELSPAQIMALKEWDDQRILLFMTEMEDRLRCRSDTENIVDYVRGELCRDLGK